MQIGSYQVLFELGRGGMGRVYLGRTVGAGGFERLVAIKRAHAPQKHSQELIDRFLNEARLAGYVHHANVVGMQQAGFDEQGHYLVCDYVEGESLAGLIERVRGDATIPVPVVTRIFHDGLAGLHAVHEAVDAAGTALGMLHRDVSVDNLLVGRDGVTRLADFGIAKSVVTPIVTEEGLRHGKLIYFSPEYLRAHPVDRTIDIYAMGVSLWTALAGGLPWQGKDQEQLLHAILIEGMPALASAGVAVAPALERVVVQACQRDRRQRFQTARQMLARLDEAAKSSGAIASQVEVAEYVEQVMGAELALRRERVRARREELERAQVGVASAGSGGLRAGSLALASDFKTIESAPPNFTRTEAIRRARPPGPPEPSIAVELLRPARGSSAGGLLPARWRQIEPTRRLAYVGVVLLVLGVGYAVLAARARVEQRAPKSPPSAASPAGEGPTPIEPRAAPREEAHPGSSAGAEAPAPERPPREVEIAPAVGVRPSEAGTKAATSLSETRGGAREEQPALEGEPASTPETERERRAERRQRSRRAGSEHSEQISTDNPYR